MAKNKKQRSERAARVDFIHICCYIALILSALFIFINNVLPLCGVKITGNLFNVLHLIQNIALLIGVGFGAYSFTRGRGKAIKIIFWIAIVLYIASAICGLF